MGAVMGLLALICLFILLFMIPNEIWAALLYIVLIGVVAMVGFGAFIIWVSAL